MFCTNMEKCIPILTYPCIWLKRTFIEGQILENVIWSVFSNGINQLIPFIEVVILLFHITQFNQIPLDFLVPFLISKQILLVISPILLYFRFLSPIFVLFFISHFDYHLSILSLNVLIIKIYPIQCLPLSIYHNFYIVIYLGQFSQLMHSSLHFGLFFLFLLQFLDLGFFLSIDSLTFF